MLSTHQIGNVSEQKNLFREKQINYCIVLPKVWNITDKISLEWNELNVRNRNGPTLISELYSWHVLGRQLRYQSLFYDRSNIGFLWINLVIVIVPWIIGMGIFVAFIRKHFVQHKTKYFVICHTGSFRARKISF